MTKSHKYIALGAILFWLIADISLPARAENHALLIGIAKYRQRTLEGPPYDVAALCRVLAAQYNFPQENIQTLVDEAATRSGILSAIARLTHRTRPGDRVFIYFSGHGTSRRDELLALPLPHTTGALVPVDFDADPDQPVEKLLAQLIIGKRDLRPALEQLDRDRQVLMVFDTCFSGNTVRSIANPETKSPNRYLPLRTKSVFKAEQQIGSFEENLPRNAPYPYQNIFYISAASDDEVAKDIQKTNLSLYPTIDGNPHGVLTDALLRVLAGGIRVDTDGDGQWSQIELYEAVKKEVQRRFRQSPQALPGAGDRARQLYARAFFVRSTDGLAAASGVPTSRAPKRQEANYQPRYSSSHALVVGIDEYRHWPRLEYAADDAREMAARLKAQGFQIYLLTNEQATLKNIVAGLERIRSAVDENSRMMFYFAGHGQTEDLPEGRERGYIVPVDADAYNWQHTMLPMDRLNRTIKRFKAKHILMAFDSCYSGLGLVRSINGDPGQDSTYIQKMMRSRSIQILTAGSRTEQAAEAAGHGLFTNHLLTALAGAADINADGYITATEIYATLRPAITRESFSRQTPQFGYIEGNGDMIFFNDFPPPESAVLTIETAVSGIDVWAGTSRIGRHLPAGSHRLAVPAGQLRLIVKKGSRTLYRYNGLLSADRVFPIRIASPAPIPIPREPFSKVTIANQSVDNYSNSAAHDLDGDGREEMVTAADNRLYVFRFDGTIVWQKNFNFPISLDLIADWDSQPAIGISGRDDDKIHLLLLNQQGEKIWQHVRKLSHHHNGKPDGSGKIAGLADIDLDGRKEVVAFALTEYAQNPCGIIVYDRQAHEVWRYSIGPAPQSILIWQKDAQRPDIIIGTYSLANGRRESENNTSDMQTYIISVDGYGKTNWQIPVGGYYTGVVVLPAGRKAPGRRSFYAHTYTSPLYREDVGAIYKISRSGQILNRFEMQNSILSVVVAESDQEEETLYAADNRGNLFKLDDRLNLLQKKPSPAGPASSQIRLVGVHDYDGDGRQDLLMYAFNRLLRDKNPLAGTGPHESAFLSDLKFEVVSQDFSRILKRVTIADAWEQRGGFAVKDLDRPETACYPFMALADKITLFNY